MKLVAWMSYHLESRGIVDDYIARVRSCLQGHEFVVCEDLESIKREIADADAMICWRITPEVFAETRKLRWIQFGSAGIDHTLFPELIASDVILTNLSGIHSIPVAEHVLALMLALTRGLDVAMRLRAERRYERAELAATSSELAGKTLGIVGLGKIGLNIARLGKAFEMRVIGTKKTPTGVLPNIDEVLAPGDLRGMLPECDFMVLVVPLTSGTKALMGRGEIESMRRGSYLINVARGSMVDLDALADALKSGKLAGAALDVFPQEPLPPDSPIYDMPNVIITPHTAGSSPRYGERAAAIFKHNFDAFLSGGRMVNVYDRDRGY
ncbi:MAG: D-2-hydroxyacid dehydrogenase [Armatimonadetes bacterium]|nr:D-2-hydroxyacid dehydrogenase [Armatimonadota bacterium]